MPERKTLARARRDRAQGKSASTQAGEFVKESLEHARSGKTPVKSRKQAIAIGLSKARKAGVKIGPNPRSKKASSGRKAAARKAAPRKTAARKTAPRKTGRRTTAAGGARRSSARGRSRR